MLILYHAVDKVHKEHYCYNAGVHLYTVYIYIFYCSITECFEIQDESSGCLHAMVFIPIPKQNAVYFSALF